MSYCGEYTAVRGEGEAAEAVSLKCRCWHCLTCAPLNKKRLKHQLLGGEPIGCITLTIKTRKEWTKSQHARELIRAWRLVKKHLRRQQAGNLFEFLPIFERTKKGNPHLHIPFRGPHFNYKAVRKILFRNIESKQFKVDWFDSPGRCVHYVIKYVAKGPGAFEGCKRHWRTRHWTLEQHRFVRRAFASGEWWRIKQKFEAWCAGMEARRWQRQGNVWSKTYAQYSTPPPGEAASA